ncbi:hypothetical protein HI914_00889 [Erysiphe necator]|nr:hypothetical protein HI914_00889 [Erysiphe necator]
MHHQSHKPHVHVKNLSIEERRTQPQSVYSYSTQSPRTPRTPRTPHKNYSCSYNGDPNTFEYDPSHKYRCKGQSKSTATSPTVSRNPQNISPQDTSQSSSYSSRSSYTPTVTAYAGPTFHSSPAPSALPIPSFYTKSILDSPCHKISKLIDNQSNDSLLQFLLKPEKEEKKNLF